MRGWLERWQVPLYVAALLVGAAWGLALPNAAPGLESAINPLLILLLYATFLAVPFTEIGSAVRDGRFVAAVLVLNFVLVPVIVFGLSRFVAHEQALLIACCWCS